MGATRYSTCPWYWFTLVKKVSGYMVVTNPLRRMRTVCLRKDACLNLLYVVLSFCSWSLATTGILRALLEYLGVTCSHRESELGISHLQQAPSPWPKPPHLCKALSRSLSVHCAHVDFGGDFRSSQPQSCASVTWLTRNSIPTSTVICIWSSFSRTFGHCSYNIFVSPTLYHSFGCFCLGHVGAQPAGC